MSKSGRAFSASLKPAWSKDKIVDWLAEHKGAFVAYVITHDRDVNVDTGEAVESHTHVYIEYDTPRKVSTVANLLGVADNFIEVVRNKKGMLRYLTHKDLETKVKYSDDEVYTNADTDYKTAVMGAMLSDKEISEYIRNGRGIELLGIVPAAKLRTIQAFLHYDKSVVVAEEIKRLNSKIDTIVEFVQQCKLMADNLALALRGVGSSLELSARELAEALGRIKIVRHIDADALEEWEVFKRRYEENGE
jgi:hypothetical protein